MRSNTSFKAFNTSSSFVCLQVGSSPSNTSWTLSGGILTPPPLPLPNQRRSVGSRRLIVQAVNDQAEPHRRVNGIPDAGVLFRGS